MVLKWFTKVREIVGGWGDSGLLLSEDKMRGMMKKGREVSGKLFRTKID